MKMSSLWLLTFTVYFVGPGVSLASLVTNSCPGYLDHQCSCNLTTGLLKPQGFNAEYVDWRAVSLAAATGVFTSSLVLTGLGLLWLWKADSAVHAAAQLFQPTARFPNVTDSHFRPVSRGSSFGSSWAAPSKKSPTSSEPREWPDRADSRGSSAKIQPGGRKWPGTFNESIY